MILATNWVSSTVGWLASLLLLLFTLRRWLFLLVVLRQQPAPTAVFPHPLPRPSCLILVPLRNEAGNLAELFPCLTALDYPPERLTVVLVDDGSTDQTAVFCQQMCAQQPRWHLLILPQTVGKAAALQQAMAQFDQGELVLVFDADERPLPTVVRQLTAVFHNPHVGAATGRRAVANPVANPIASYTAFENMVHQLVTVQAKDRLGLLPPLLGSNCAYRRAALTAVGGFQPGTLLEDSDLTLRLGHSGWQTRFVPSAVATHTVPATLSGYLRQHRRWAAGFQQVAQRRRAVPTRSLPWWLRLELWLFAAGYLDRVALLVLLATMGWQTAVGQPVTRWSLHLLVLYAATPLLQTMVALRNGRSPWQLWARLMFLPIFFVFDIAVALLGICSAILGRPIPWEARPNKP